MIVENCDIFFSKQFDTDFQIFRNAICFDENKRKKYV